MTSDYFGGDSQINYSYLGVSIAILIVIYFMVYSTKYKFHDKKLYNDNISKNTISVRTLKGITMIEPNIFEMYIMKFKINVTELVNLRFKNTDIVKNSILKAKKVIESYINLNSNLYTGSIIEKECEFDSHIKTELSETDDEIKNLLLKLLMDLDIIIFLIRSSLCKKGTFDLTVIDTLVSEIYKNNCLTSIDLFGPDVEKKSMLNFIPDVPDNWSKKHTPNVPAASRMSESSHYSSNYF